LGRFGNRCIELQPWLRSLNTRMDHDTLVRAVQLWKMSALPKRSRVSDMSARTEMSPIPGIESALLPWTNFTDIKLSNSALILASFITRLLYSTKIIMCKFDGAESCACFSKIMRSSRYESLSSSRLFKKPCSRRYGLSAAACLCKSSVHPTKPVPDDMTTATFFKAYRIPGHVSHAPGSALRDCV
jgi:hypothetical protein